MIELRQIITLSQTMLEKAREDDWEEVTVLEAQRSLLIEVFFSKPDVKDLGDEIQSILAIDREIMALGNLIKADLAETLHTLSQGKRAVKAYSS